jgi:tetratricopeptide (TPR) repeat protein
LRSRALREPPITASNPANLGSLPGTVKGLHLMSTAQGRFVSLFAAESAATRRSWVRAGRCRRAEIAAGLCALALLASFGAIACADPAPAPSAPAESTAAAAPVTDPAVAPAIDHAPAASADKTPSPAADHTQSPPAEHPAPAPVDHSAATSAERARPSGSEHAQTQSAEHAAALSAEHAQTPSADHMQTAPVERAQPATARAVAVATPSPSTAFTPPQTLNDIAAWLEYRTRNHVASLPQEARIFYRRGLLMHQSGSTEEAVRIVRGAAELDPDFVSPRLTLASWFLMQEPSQALLQYAAVLELIRQNFNAQLALVANAAFLVLQALFLGLLVAALLVLWVRNAELRHTWEENLNRSVSAGAARVWAWSFVILPFAVGVGLALPAVVMLGMAWPSLRARERAVFVMLVALLGVTPWVASSLDRLAVPLSHEQGPFYGTAALATEPYSAERHRELLALAQQHPDNPFVEFGLGWEARRGGDLQLAETAYRRALELWPNNDRVMNNLGNTLAALGRQDEALALYQKAYGVNPMNSAAYFNASQIFTQRYEYRAATDALSRASALNFDLVKNYQSQAANDGLLPLADEWLAPRTFWEALSTLPPSHFDRMKLPPTWRTRIECSGWAFSIIAVVLALLSVGFGVLQNRSMPLRPCSNCSRVVCRRCAQRRRETALCAACAAVESRAETPDFARVLLLQHRRSLAHRQDMLRTAVATLIPGYGLLALNRLLLPLVLLIGSAGLASAWFGLGAPFSFEPRLALSGSEFPVPVIVGLWIAIYAVSILGYFSAVVRLRAQTALLDAPVRSRATQSTRRANAAAA